MKTLYVIGGTMGVGKTAASQALKTLMPNAVFLDGDWCWDMDPFVVNEETKAMVLGNICACLNGFLHCSTLENIIFCWVLHEQSIIDELLSRLDLNGCRVVTVSLVCSQDELCRRLEKDIAAGIRKPDIIQRSLARLPMYQKLHTHSLDTTAMLPEETAAEIAKIL